VADAGSPSGQPHTGLVKALVVIASVLVLIACFATWAERQALTTDDWVDTSGRLLENKAIQGALANYAVDQLYANVDVATEVKKALPPDFKQLSGPASTGLRALGTDGAERVLATARFQELWKQANRTAHENLLAIIDDNSNVVKSNNGEVVLRLRPLIIQLADQLGIGSTAADKLPEDAGNLRILRSDQLGLAQTVAKAIRGLALVTSLLAIALFGLAIYLSRGYRWVTVLATGIGLILVGIVVLILREVIGGVVSRQLATETARPAADAAWSIGTSLLASIAHNVIIFGLFFIVAAWLASPHPSSVETRRALAPVLREYPAAVAAVLGTIALIWLISAADSTRSTLTRLVLIGMAGAGLYELRRWTMREFPNESVTEMPTKVRDRCLEWWHQRGRPALAAAGGDGSAPPEPQDRRLERLERLAALRERGALSDKEFEAEKASLLAGESDDG
jgi:hypothetical protein